MKVKEALYALLLSFNVYLLLSGMHSAPVVLILMLSSVILALHSPLALVPLMFVTSITSKFVVLPNIAGYFYYIFLFTSICFLKYSRRTNRMQSIAWSVFTILYLVWIVISSVNSVSGEYESAVKIIISIVPILFIPLFEYKESKSLPIYMLVTAITLSGYVLFKLLFAPAWYVATVNDSITYENMLNAQLTISEDLNPNTLAQCLLLAYIVIYAIAINAKKWWLLLFTIVPIASMMMIGSRTVFITMLAVSVFALLFSVKRSVILKVAIIAAVAFCGFKALEYSESVNERLDMDTIVEDEGSGRFDTWQSLMHNVVPLYPISGVGYGRINLERLGYAVDADNMYMDALSQMGFVGVAILLVMLLLYFKMLWKSTEINSRIAILFLLFVFVVGFGETVFDTFIFAFILFYAALAKMQQDNSNPQIK